MKLSIYDFDGTFVNIQTVPMIFNVWDDLALDKTLSKRYYRQIKWWYLMHKLKLGWSKETFRKNAMALMVELLNHLNDIRRKLFAEAFYRSCQPHIATDLQQKLKIDHNDGYHCILLSGNFEELLEPFKVEGFDDVIGSKTEINGQKLNFSNIEIIINEKKIDAICSIYKEHDITHMKAYADSGYDLSLLLYVNEPYAYRPDK